jgi:hypothetical protein
MIGRKYWEVKKKDRFQMALLLFIFIILSGIFALLFLPGYWYFWLVIFVVALALLLEWHAKNFAYCCPRCGKVFEISMFEDLFCPNSVNKKYLQCPICKRRAWAEILRIKEASFLRNKLLFEEQNNTGYEKGKG